MRIFSDYLYHEFLVHYGSYFSALKKLCFQNENQEQLTDQNAPRNSFLYSSFNTQAIGPRVYKTPNQLVFDENFLIFQTSFMQFIEPCLIPPGYQVQLIN